MPKRVFISYSQDSATHSERVLDLSNRLRADGVDCHIDQYETHPPKGWLLWMEAQVEEADFVLVVCTEEYTKKSRENKKSGAKFESILILQDLYDADMLNEKFIPVLFDDSDKKHILKWLRPYNHYQVGREAGYEQLRRRLLDDPEVVKPPLGTPVKKGPKPLVRPSQTMPRAAGQMPMIASDPSNIELARVSEPLNIFISYSHLDKYWLKELQVYLKPLERDKSINLWDDTRIKAGAHWKNQIEQALKTTHVAILLVSAYFLASDFIVDEELQPLLQAAKDKGVLILPIIIDYNEFQSIKSLSTFQAVNDPQRPLAVIPKSRRGKVFLRVTKRIKEALRQRQEQRKAEQKETRSSLGVKEEIGRLQETPPSIKKAKAEGTAAVDTEAETSTEIEAKEPAAHIATKTPVPEVTGASISTRLENPPAKPAMDNHDERSPARLPKTRLNAWGMEFVLIPAGTFLMGSTNGERNERPVHSVKITKPFYLGRYPVTQAQWEKVMEKNPSHFKGEDRPVETVSWTAVQEFISRLNEEEGCGNCYRLPTEAEWEYAARGGMEEDYAGYLRAIAWYGGNAGGKTHPVGQKASNAWGLHDMLGNIWEWVGDWYGSGYYQSSPEPDPLGPESGSIRVFRGGSWRSPASNVQLARRFYRAPNHRSNNLGFRLVREVT